MFTFRIRIRRINNLFFCLQTGIPASTFSTKLDVQSVKQTTVSVTTVEPAVVPTVSFRHHF
jgi:hypothetical protein